MSDANDAVAALLEGEMDKIKDSENQFNQAVASQQSHLDGVYKQMIERLGKGKEPELPPEIKEIVTVLQVQPRLIPAVQRFLQTKVAELNAAIDQVLGPIE